MKKMKLIHQFKKKLKKFKKKRELKPQRLIFKKLKEERYKKKTKLKYLMLIMILMKNIMMNILKMIKIVIHHSKVKVEKT